MSHRGTSFDNPEVDAVFIGALLAVTGIYHLWRGWGTGDWRPTSGLVTEVFMSEEERVDEDDDSAKPGVFYKARIVYTYTVKGVEYEGGTLQRGLFRMGIRYFAQKQIEGYRRGQKVVAYYCPSDPSHAVLKRGAPTSAYVMSVSGLILLLLGWKFW